MSISIRHHRKKSVLMCRSGRVSDCDRLSILIYDIALIVGYTCPVFGRILIGRRRNRRLECKIGNNASVLDNTLFGDHNHHPVRGPSHIAGVRIMFIKCHPRAMGLDACKRTPAPPRHLPPQQRCSSSFATGATPARWWTPMKEIRIAGICRL